MYCLEVRKWSSGVCSLTQRGRFPPRGTNPPLFLFAKQSTDGRLDAFLFAGFVERILAGSGDTISREARRREKRKSGMNTGTVVL